MAGDLVHTGSGELHAYPFLPDPDLGCAADPVHLATLTLDVVLMDPDNVVDQDRFFEGHFECALGGEDVTPADNTWKLRAGADARVLSDQIPAGAVCKVTERLDAPPAPFRAWADPVVEPDMVVVAKRQNLGSTITNRVKDLPPCRPRSPPRRPPPRRPPPRRRSGPGASGAADPVVVTDPVVDRRADQRPELPARPRRCPRPPDDLTHVDQRLRGAERRAAARERCGRAR